MNLLWLDFETTGLDPTCGSILEAGWILTDGRGVPWEQHDGDGAIRRSAVLPFDLDVAPLADNVREMHTRNGLRDRCRELWGHGIGHLSELKSVEETILSNVNAMWPAVEYPEAPYLAGSSVHFDLAWVRRHMPRLAERVSYRVYDVSAVVLFCRSLGMPKPEETKDKPHRALFDLDRSIALAQKCDAWLRARETK